MLAHLHGSAAISTSTQSKRLNSPDLGALNSAQTNVCLLHFASKDLLPMHEQEEGPCEKHRMRLWVCTRKSGGVFCCPEPSVSVLQLVLEPRLQNCADDAIVFELLIHFSVEDASEHQLDVPKATHRFLVPHACSSLTQPE